MYDFTALVFWWFFVGFLDNEIPRFMALIGVMIFMRP
jgi:hypothetical protein